MSDLNGAIFYATMRGIGDLTFDSVGQRKDTIASFALRCSMSIPLVFILKVSTVAGFLMEACEAIFL